MIKRIKARVKQPKSVPDDFAREVFCKGRHLTEFCVFPTDMAFYQIKNIRYKGKVYFVVRIRHSYGSANIKECIEL